MNTTNLFLGYIKPQLLILIPLTWAIGKGLKDSFVQKELKQATGLRGWLRNAIRWFGIKPALYLIDFVLAFAIGLLEPAGGGVWRWLLQAVVVFGICHGCVACFMATKLYDLHHDEKKGGEN